MSRFAGRTKKETTPTATIKDAPLFFTMPSKYRGGQPEQLVIASPKPPAATTPAAPPVQKPTLPPTTPKTPLKTKKGKRGPLVFLVAGLMLLGGCVVGAYVYVQSLQTTGGEVEVPVPVQEPPASSTSTEPVATTPTTPIPSESVNPFPVGRITGIDSDSDGLTDVEESTLYATDPRKPDSDSDGFLDGNEVFHRYNPNGDAPGTLEEAGLVRLFTQGGATARVTLLYPTSWSAVVDPVPIVPGATSTASFTASSGERVVSEVYTKEATESIAAWMSRTEHVREGSSTHTKNGLVAFVARDQLTAIIDGGTELVLLTYRPNESGAIEFLQTFKMMLNSLLFVREEPLLDAPAV